jgi:mannose/cellobiose epimerase-like protein (N-acyl-D-glucosamine 2-epimerase family)
MKVDQLRANVFSVTATGQELSALIAAARLAADVMRADADAPREALDLLERVLRDYDHALARLQKEDGRPERPS